MGYVSGLEDSARPSACDRFHSGILRAASGRCSDGVVTDSSAENEVSLLDDESVTVEESGAAIEIIFGWQLASR
jgi:hypothetical protein